MTMSVNKLSVLAYAAGWTQWLYKDTSVPVRHFLEPGFFSAAKDMLSDNDQVILVGKDGSSTRTVAFDNPSLWDKTNTTIALRQLLP